MRSVADDRVVADPRGHGRRMSPEAQRLRLPLHQRSQQRMTQRWGFTLDAADAPERARVLHDAAPDDAEVLVLLSAILSSRGEDEAGLVAARRAVELTPGSARAHSTLAAILGRRGDPEGALAETRRAVELDPDDPAARHNLGALLWSRGERGAARGEFAVAARLLGLPPAQPWWGRWRRR